MGIAPATPGRRQMLPTLHRLITPILLTTSLAASPLAAGDTTCGWQPVNVVGNTLTLLPGSAPPWIDPTAPCTCCVTGAKYGLGVFGTPPNSGAFVFYSLGTADIPLFGETWVIDPFTIVASVFLTPDPGSPTFANSCWVEDDCFTIPENPALIGLVVHLQAAAPSPPDWALSNRLELVIGTEF